MNYRITHRTLYEYAAPVSVSQHVARLTPRMTLAQSFGDFTLTINPTPSLRSTRTDYFGNELCFFSIQELHKRLEIVTQSQVTVKSAGETLLEESPAWEELAWLFRDPVSPGVIEPYEFVFDSPQIRASQEEGTPGTP